MEASLENSGIIVAGGFGSVASEFERQPIMSIDFASEYMMISFEIHIWNWKSIVVCSET